MKLWMQHLTVGKKTKLRVRCGPRFLLWKGPSIVTLLEVAVVCLSRLVTQASQSCRSLVVWRTLNDCHVWATVMFFLLLWSSKASKNNGITVCHVMKSCFTTAVLVGIYFSPMISMFIGGQHRQIICVTHKCTTENFMVVVSRCAVHYYYLLLVQWWSEKGTFYVNYYRN